MLKQRKPIPKNSERRAYTIDEFCEAHRISQGLYYKLRKKGLGPAETRFGSKIIVSAEAAEKWRNPETEETAA